MQGSIGHILFCYYAGSKLLISMIIQETLRFLISFIFHLLRHQPISIRECGVEKIHRKSFCSTIGNDINMVRVSGKVFIICI